MLILFIFFIGLFFSHFTLEAELPPININEASTAPPYHRIITLAERINILTSRLFGPQHCPYAYPPQKCLDLSQGLCQQLWDEEHRGNMDFAGDRFRLGTSQKSQLPESTRIDLWALVNSYENLPLDFRRPQLKKILHEFKNALANENDSQQWNLEILGIQRKFQREIDNISMGRMRIEMSKKRQRDNTRSFSLANPLGYLLRNSRLQRDIVNAKYKDHPHWQRVQNNFKLAQIDLIKAIDETNFSLAEKIKLKKKIQSVHLYLPEKMVGFSCSGQTVNAFYDLPYNAVTICPGLFNQMQSDGAIYHILSHELAHSISQTAFSYDQFLEGPMGQVLMRLVDDRQEPYTCDEWQNIKNKIFKAPPIESAPLGIYQNLINCFGIWKGPGKFNDENLNKVVKKNVMKAISAAKNAAQISLKQANIGTTEAQGVLKALALATNKRYLPLFSQEKKCSQTNNNSEISKKALHLAEIVEKMQYSYCGRDCLTLNKTKLGQHTGEFTSDWWAARALLKGVKRFSSTYKKKAFIAAAGITFCEKSPTSAAPLQFFNNLFNNRRRRRRRRLPTILKTILEERECFITK